MIIMTNKLTFEALEKRFWFLKCASPPFELKNPNNNHIIKKNRIKPLLIKIYLFYALSFVCVIGKQNTIISSLTLDNVACL